MEGSRFGRPENIRILRIWIRNTTKIPCCSCEYLALFRKHTKARPYLCRGCGKHWRDLLITKKHIRQAHAADYSLCHYDASLDVDNPYVS